MRYFDSSQKMSLAALSLVSIFSMVVSGCSQTSGGTSTGNPIVAASEDNSTSGVAAAAVGGAMSGSGPSASLAYQMRKLPRSGLMANWLLPLAQASNTCPTYRTASAAGCTASGGDMWLTYNSCTFSGGATQWSGYQGFFLSSGSASCGSFPLPPAAGTQTRQYVTASGGSTPGSITEVSSFGTTATIDDSSSNLDNFDSDAIATLLNGGYGAQVTFAGSGARTALTVGHHIVVSGGIMDHTVTGTLTVTESPGAITRTVQGTAKVYHNLLQVIGTSTFNSVVQSDTCCLPISGSITTLFSAGTKPPLGKVAAAMVGASETLSFTGCGTAQLKTYDGLTQSVALSRCF